MNLKSERFISLDVLRGLTIIGMILVNTQGEGDKFACLGHAVWDGCVMADMVYPFFLYIVGASIYFAFQKYAQTPFSQVGSAVLLKVIKRGILIFSVGFLLFAIPFQEPFETWRIPGVLQRIALVYVATAFTVLAVKNAGRLVGITIAILLLYWGMLILGGSTPQENWAKLVDQAVFGSTHLYADDYDPEGLLGSIPSVANALMGYLTSYYIVKLRNKGLAPHRVYIIGTLLIALALLWENILPFNKRLWSSSFALYTSGWAVVLYAAFYWIIDVKKQCSWAPFFLVFGTNALFTYVLSELILIFNYMFPFTMGEQQYVASSFLDFYLFHPITDTPFRALLWGVFVLLICWGVAYPLYKNKIYIKL